MGLKILIDVDVLKEHKLMPTHYVMLYYLYNNLDCKISPQTQSDLFKLGFIDQKGNITESGKNIFREPDKISEDKTKDIKLLLESMLEWFPKGVKTGGKPVRTSINSELIQKMKKFKKEYKYEDEIILKATQKYSEEYKKNGYNYMRQFKYFINKQGAGSDLADYCEMIKNGETINDGTSESRNRRTL